MKNELVAWLVNLNAMSSYFVQFTLRLQVLECCLLKYLLGTLQRSNSVNLSGINVGNSSRLGLHVPYNHLLQTAILRTNWFASFRYGSCGQTYREGISCTRKQSIITDTTATYLDNKIGERMSRTTNLCRTNLRFSTRSVYHRSRNVIAADASSVVEIGWNRYTYNLVGGA